MIRKLAFVFVIAGFGLPLFMICRGFSNSLVAKSAGETESTIEVTSNEVSTAPSAT